MPLNCGIGAGDRELLRILGVFGMSLVGLGNYRDHHNCDSLGLRWRFDSEAIQNIVGDVMGDSYYIKKKLFNFINTLREFSGGDEGCHSQLITFDNLQQHQTLS